MEQRETDGKEDTDTEGIKRGIGRMTVEKNKDRQKGWEEERKKERDTKRDRDR
jgi:hypothetical protein